MLRVLPVEHRASPPHTAAEANPYGRRDRAVSDGLARHKRTPTEGASAPSCVTIELNGGVGMPDYTLEWIL
jgi:hypothetical protein